MTLAKDLNIPVITAREILPGVEIWEVTRDTANMVVRQHRSEAWRLFLPEEIDRYMMATPEEIEEVIRLKRIKPGPYLK
jgi:hypothetical protein